MVVKIFANNFRGFRELNIDMDKNIFLVGDNSSGKSSILHLITYVYRSELLGSPRLDDDHNVYRYDFFSPYFDFDDVTIGFISTRKKKQNARVITFRKKPNLASPEVIRFTTVSGGKRLTFLKRGTKILYKYTDIGTADQKILREIHTETTGFSKMPTDRDEEHQDISSPAFAVSLLSDRAHDSKLLELVLGTAAVALPSVVNSGPVRGLPEPFYSLERKVKSSGAHFAAMWHDLNSEQEPKAVEAIRKFGRDSLLFEDISVEKISKRVENSPLTVTVTRQGKRFLINQVGVGVSQVIPIIIESLFYNLSGRDSLLLLQQPELHLHPIAQAAMGEFLFSMSKDRPRYVVETHSDFLVDRFRANIKESSGKSSARILFCQNSEDGNSCSAIEVSDDGEIVNPPENYKEFFVNELLRTMF
ncbi:AAA family ATPase [Rhizobium rhizogenes]|uniref:AAA family ATPase n=1 Tax=Rhizobium rhizogenes TaxID=359 RepID=UPI0015720212|nr:AAA family ATPase [Rhizobium rhizogenes]NTF41673.1 AAA family ATPase [Rhizobium rhizogenes]